MGATRFDLVDSFLLLLGCEFEALEFLEGYAQIVLDGHPLALQLLQGGAEIFPSRIDRAKKGGECESSNVGVVGALPLAGNAILEIRKFALGIGAHRIERCHPPLEFIDAKAPVTITRMDLAQKYRAEILNRVKLKRRLNSPFH